MEEVVVQCHQCHSHLLVESNLGNNNKTPVEAVGVHLIHTVADQQVAVEVMDQGQTHLLPHLLEEYTQILCPIHNRKLFSRGNQL